MGLNTTIQNSASLPISYRVNAVRAHFRRQGTPYKGIRVIFLDGEAEVFAPRDAQTGTALINLDKLDTKAFKVFVNMNGEIAIQQIAKLPHFVLV